MPHSDLCNLGSWWVKIHGCAKDLIVLIHMSLIGVYWYAKLQLPASVLNLQTGWLFFVCFETICYFIIEQFKGFFCFVQLFFHFCFSPANLLVASLGRGTCISCNSFYFFFLLLTYCLWNYFFMHFRQNKVNFWNWEFSGQFQFWQWGRRAKSTPPSLAGFLKGSELVLCTWVAAILPLSGRYCAYDILPYLPKVVRADSFVTQIDLARILLCICHGSKLID